MIGYRVSAPPSRSVPIPHCSSIVMLMVIAAWGIKEELLVPPLRLVSAAMWQVVQRGDVQEYGTLEEFICTVSDMVPHLLNPEQKAQLLLGLRAR
ncbi:hypothetical protein CRUP_023435, partial [Coryphaenoides rupestris]